MLIAAATLAFLVGFATPAVAQVVYSDRGTLVTRGGVTYSNQARAENEGSTSSADTTTYASSTVPASYMGSEARVMYSNGSLCKTSGMTYTNRRLSSYRQTVLYGGSADVGACGDGYFFSKDKSAVWKGNGYSYYFTLRTVNIYMVD